MRLILFVVFSLLAIPLSATHLLGGYISYKTDNSSLECKITVRLLTDDAGVSGGSGTLDFGDGSNPQHGNFDLKVEPRVGNVSITSFVVKHTYPGPGIYNISYEEPNYNFGMLNIENAGNQPLIISAKLILNSSTGNNSSPVLQLLNSEKGVSGIAQRINPAAFDANGDSLSYTLTIPEVQEYTYPNNANFYTDYSTGNQANNGEPEYSINPVSGEILWDAPELAGEYVIGFNITQWRKVEGEWINIGNNEVILFDRITDAEQEIVINAPPSQCFDNKTEVQGQFSLSGPQDKGYNVYVYSDLEGALINGRSVDAEEVLDFELMEDLQLDVTIPAELTIKPFKPYKVVVAINTSSEYVTTSWSFAVGCNSFPENISPEPIVDEPEEKDCEKFTIYPNPASDGSIQVCLPVIRDGVKYTRIVDTSGRTLFEQNIDPTSFPVEIDVSNLHYGIYILQVNEYAGKFIVRE